MWNRFYPNSRKEKGSPYSSSIRTDSTPWTVDTDTTRIWKRTGKRTQWSGKVTQTDRDRGQGHSWTGTHLDRDTSGQGQRRTGTGTQMEGGWDTDGQGQ
jgi:hypothetical protein